MSSCGRHHGGARWKTSCAILHGVEFWFGTPVGNYGKLPHTIRRHSRGKPALPDASERLSERLPGVLCPVSLCAISGSPIRGGGTIFHRREQSLRWAANDRNEAFWKRVHGTTELHLEPLHGHRLKRRILAVLGGGKTPPPARGLPPRPRAFPLRTPAHAERYICHLNTG